MRRLALLLATTVLVAPGGIVLGAAPAQAQSAAETVRIFDIPAKPIRQSLNDIARITGISVMFDETAAASMPGKAVKGSMTTAQAISQVLAGSDLTWRFTNASTVTIAATNTLPRSAASGDSTVLSPIVVEGQSNRTEGTGLYTTGQMNSATGLGLTARQTPQSVSVVTSQKVKDTNSQTITELLKSSPGIYANETDGYRSEPYSRGFYIDRFQYDGLTTNAQNGWHGEHSNELAFYDHAEIVRGSTGLLSGAGNPSASINLVRKRADKTTAGGSITASGGSWNSYRSVLDYSTPLNKEGTVRGRFVGVYQDKEAFWDREHMKRGAAYGTLEFDLTEDTLLTVGADYQKRKTDGAQWGGIPAMLSDGRPANLPRSFSTSTDWTYYEAQTWNAFARLDHEFDNGWKIRGDYLERGSNYDSKMNFPRGVLNPDGSGLSFAPSYMIADAEQRVFNLSVNGEYELFGQTHELVAGVSSDRARQNYYFRSRTSLTPISNMFEWNGSMAEPGWTNPYYYLTEINQKAAFAATRLTLADGLRAIVGGRYVNWEQNTYGTVADGSTFIPYAAISYDLNENFTAYASYTDIFAPQTSLDRNGGFLDPKTGRNYEVGLKGEFLDGRISGSVAVFKTLQDNVAVADTGYYVPGTSNQAYRGEKGVETRGIEAEIGGEISYGWNVSLNAAYQESHNITGERVNPHIPRATAGLFTTYDLAGDWEGLTVGGGVRWQGGTSRPIASGTQTYNFRETSFTTVDLMARYKINDSVEAQLNVNNVFDKTYSRLTEDGLLFYGAPRNATLSITAKF